MRLASASMCIRKSGCGNGTWRNVMVALDRSSPPTLTLAEVMAKPDPSWTTLTLMVKEAKMRGFVSPGELLTINVSVLHEGSGFAITSARVSVGGELRSNATITFRHVPFPHPDLRVHMDAEAKRIGFPQELIAHG